MKMSKLEGIKLLEMLELPTIKRLNIVQILDGKIPLNEGISLRLSPKGNNFDRNVYLPSIHNCQNLETIKKFIILYNNNYNIFAHYTVSPEVIGSVSKMNFADSIVIETYKNFDHRKKEIIDNRVTIPLLFGRIWISKMQIEKKDEHDLINFKKVFSILKDIPFEEYDMEYVIQNGKLVLTDLTLPNTREYQKYKHCFLENRNSKDMSL